MNRIALALAGLCTIYACARQAPPPGGPEDRTAPTVMNMDPAPGTSSVELQQTIRLSFSKSMRKSEVEHSVHFFPPPAAPPHVHWDGHDLVITPDTAWDSGQTYVLTLPAEATDIRGNRLTGTYQSAFSTGTHIDSGRIVGQVLTGAKPAAGAWVLCYSQAAASNPEVDSADYVVQADEQGQFALSYLGPGTYRVFALVDRDKDWLWNIGAEDIAVPSGDLTLDASGPAFLPALHCSDLDTVSPVLLSCASRSSGWWALEFDGEWPRKQLDSLQVFLVRGGDTSACDTVIRETGSTEVLLAHRGAIGPSEPAELLIRLAGSNRPSQACTPELAADTLAVFGPVAMSPDTAAGWLCAPEQISLEFREPLAAVRENSFRLEQEPVDARLQSAFELILSADWARIESGSPRVVISPGAVTAMSGRIWPGTDTVRLTLPLLPRDSTGDFDIHIAGLPETANHGVRLSVWPVSSPASVCPLELSGDRVQGRLAGGDYLMSLLWDTDGDRAWSAGWPAPFVPAERLWYPTDTLRIRPRFTTEFNLSLVR